MSTKKSKKHDHRKKQAFHETPSAKLNVTKNIQKNEKLISEPEKKVSCQESVNELSTSSSEEDNHFKTYRKRELVSNWSK